MLLELDKQDLISLCKGNSPSYEQMDNPKIKPLGNFNGSYGRWDWNFDAFNDLSENQLLEIYQILKK